MLSLILKLVCTYNISENNIGVDYDFEKYFKESCTESSDQHFIFNPLTLRAAKRDLTILEICNLQTHFLETFEGENNVDHKPDKNSPSNIW